MNDLSARLMYGRDFMLVPSRLWTALGLLAIVTPSAAGQFGTMTRVSVGTGGIQAGDESYDGYISGDGRFALFTSRADNLVPGDTNVRLDTFLHDRGFGTTERVSVASGGAQGNDHSGAVGISWDGRYILYGTSSTNIILPDTNGFKGDLILRERVTGIQRFVSVSMTGDQGNDDVLGGALSSDARFVAFVTASNNLVPNDTNGWPDIFVRDLMSSVTTIESISDAGVQSNNYSGGSSISADGRFVAFWSSADNLVVGDTNQAVDFFVRDRHTGIIQRASVTSAGTQTSGGGSTGMMSSGGRYFVFDSNSPDFVAGDTNQSYDIFLRDLVLGTTKALSVSAAGNIGNGSSESPSISADGQMVSFHSQATNLVIPSGSSLDVYVRDVTHGITRRASNNAQGQQGNSLDRDARISGDGRFVIFRSWSTNLVPGDSNGFSDTFVQEAPLPNPFQFCPPGTSALGCVPVLTTTGQPSASSGVPFEIRLDAIPSHSWSLAFYGYSTSTQLPFGGSWLCVAPPLRRTFPLATGGITPQFDCTGSSVLDFNAWIQSGFDPGLMVGRDVWLQVWTGDRVASLGVLSPAMVLEILP